MFARTPRLLLRPGWKEDAPALAAAISDIHVSGKLGDLPWPCRTEDAEAFLSQDHGRLPQLLAFARTHGAPRLVGGVGLAANDSGVELGYWIARPYWGLGFATEAGRAVIDMADKALRLPRLLSGHFANNSASGRVLRKLGFVPTGATGWRFCRSREFDEPMIEYTRSAFASPADPPRATLGYDREAMAA